MLKSSIGILLDKVLSKYSLYTLQAEHAYELETGVKPTQEFKSVKATLQALGETESGNVVIHPDPEAKRAAALACIEAKRLAKEEEERKIREQIVKKKEEGERI